MPKVSVIVPVYNSKEYIKNTVLSILEQSFQDFEIVVVDDASTDDTAEVVNSIGSQKIIYIRLTQNHGGPSKPRNIGLNNAHGEYIAFCDSDDLMLPGRLESAAAMLDAFPTVGMVFTDAQRCDDKTGVYEESFLNGYDRFTALKRRTVDSKFFIIDKEKAFNCLFFENFILPSGVTIRRKVFEKVGIFDESLTNADDWDMWFRVCQYFSLGYLEVPSFKYTVRGGSISNRGGENGKNRIKVLKKRLAFGLESDVAKQARKLVARNYADMGYWCRCTNQMRLARRNYVLSLRERMEWSVVLQLLVTLLGQPGIDFLRKIRKALTKQEQL